MTVVAAQALHEWVLPVAADSRPPLEVAWLRARDVVFAVHEQAAPEEPVSHGAFLGVVSWSAAASLPGRIFADLLPQPEPAPIDPNCPLEHVLERLDQACCGALPVLEEGRFQGVVTRRSVGEALVSLGAERALDRSRCLRALQRLHRLETHALRVQGLTHDLANALSAVENLAELLVRVGPPNDHASLLRDAARHGVSLLGRLRAESEDDHHPEPVSGAGLAECLARQARLQISPGVELDLQVQAADAHVRVDRTDLERVLANLVANAQDAMGQHGQLTLRFDQLSLDGQGCDAQGVTIPAGRWFRIAVTDSGHGMDEALQRAVMQPLFSTRAASGRGLGLCTVQRLVRRNQGVLRCESAPGRGTTFEVLVRPT